MSKRIVIYALCVVCLLVNAADGTEKADELVSNPNFQPSPTSELPQDWTVWKPIWEPAACSIKSTKKGLLIQGKDPYAVGGVTQEIKNIKGGQAYAIEALCEFENKPTPYQSVLVRLYWLRAGRLLHPAGILLKSPAIKGNAGTFADVLIAPDSADVARISLEVKWPRGGSVVWKSVSMQPTARPKPRKVKVGAVYLRPRNSTPEKNMALWCEQIDAAGKLGLDIVCLGEVIQSVGTSATILDCAQQIPGPATEQLGLAAKKNSIYVVATINEKAGDVVYNTAVLIDRRGNLAGKYRKVHLPREEWKQGVRPGDQYPVFETDFGKVAIQICYDWFFPEPESIFALKCAEIIFAPTWGNTLPDKDGCVDGETTFRVRARDNGVYMVPCVYDGNSMVIDPMGRILASSNGKTGVFWAEIDLNKKEPLDWVGHWRSIAPRHRMPETYAPLLETERKTTP
ncbi:MAG: carbon-nitrogen hydrolase family protein [Sedimentisphaerales bacterium]|nr:carbon-nitrogen hydrolase family protein [Sedimentisphaerales bacterium]